MSNWRRRGDKAPAGVSDRRRSGTITSEDNRIIKAGGYPINIVGGRKFPQAAKLHRDLRPTDKSDWRASTTSPVTWARNGLLAN